MKNEENLSKTQPEFLSETIPIVKQKVENSNVSNIYLFKEWVPGTINTLGRH
jgi:hypothetical protein